MAQKSAKPKDKPKKSTKATAKPQLSAPTSPKSPKNPKVSTPTKLPKNQKTPQKSKKPTDKLADRTLKTRLLQGVFGDSQKKILAKLTKKSKEIEALAPKYAKLTDKELKDKILDYKEKYNDKDAKYLDNILNDVFAIVREMSDRILKMRHFPVQLIGGQVLHSGNVAEMKTGEGKTLVATLPAVLNAISGKGVHIVTVNDYLAQRDAGWMGELYHALGLSVGVIISEASFLYDPTYDNENHSDPGMRKLKPATRKEAYNADITYGTNNEYGFDYLRDNMVSDTNMLRQRELNFAIVDEVDSILIDEARTPLIISAPAGDNPDSYYQFARIMTKLGDEDYLFDEKRRSVTLTDSGLDKIQTELGIKDLYSVDNTRAVYHVEQAIKAEVVFRRDKDYVVTNSGEVIIVDEHTGRLMHGRRYNEGLHQAIEAKEKVAVKEESMTLATISFQNFFRLYNKLSGMTGTAFTEAEEFQQIYALDVIQIPPNKPIIREDKDDLIYRTEAGKLRAVAAEIKKYHDKGQPVLVGSASIVKNELIADYLRKEGIDFEILNAKNNEREAEIIAKAGEVGAVTLATNMAGRGTDIKLGKGVAELGGLVVIGSERHESRRIDNQLRGRGGRQGDPGTTQFFVSAEDDLMRIFQGDRVASLLVRMGVDEDTPIQARSMSKTLEAAQKRIEGFNFDSRKHVVQYDNVINRHRKVVYAMRRKILGGEDIRTEIGRLIRESVEQLTLFSARINKDFDYNFTEIFKGIDENTIHSIGLMRKEKERYKLALAAAEALYSEKERELTEEVIRKVEREIYLQVLDSLWMMHLENMQHLREGIHWRSVGQRDPLVEYRSESQKLFDGLQQKLREEVLSRILKLHKSDIAPLSDDEYETALTDMMDSANAKGVNEISKGQESLDSEFRAGGAKVVKNVKDLENRKKNQAKKNKKKARKNKKSGRKNKK